MPVDGVRGAEHPHRGSEWRDSQRRAWKEPQDTAQGQVTAGPSVSLLPSPTRACGGGSAANSTAPAPSRDNRG